MLASVDVAAKHEPTNSTQIASIFTMRGIIVSLDFELGKISDGEAGADSGNLAATSIANLLAFDTLYYCRSPAVQGLPCEKHPKSKGRQLRLFAYGGWTPVCCVG